VKTLRAQTSIQDRTRGVIPPRNSSVPPLKSWLRPYSYQSRIVRLSFGVRHRVQYFLTAYNVSASNNRLCMHSPLQPITWSLPKKLNRCDGRLSLKIRPEFETEL